MTPLGHLELTVMEILWDRGEANVRDVAGLLERPLAYTTVMTTLDRLFKKGLLARRKEDRAFVYVPKCSRLEWEQKRAGDLISALPSGLLISYLVETAGQKDAAMLDELERKIRLKRRELDRQRKS